MRPGYDIDKLRPKIQALLLAGFRQQLPRSRYLALKFDSRQATQSAIQKLVPKITPGDTRPPEELFCLAISAQGLKRLGLGDDTEHFESFHFPSTLDTFPAVFVGDISSKRARGVIGETDSAWRWGGTEHIADLFLVHLTPSDKYQSDETLTDAIDHAVATSARVLLDLSYTTENQNGPFGFLDGVSNPELIQRKHRPGFSQEPVEPGEFLLGFPNSLGQLAMSPSVPIDFPQAEHLPFLHDDFGLRRDLGKYGSFLVVQQFRAETDRFSAIDQSIANKMIGRKPSGEPLLPQPHTASEPAPDVNAFAYTLNDRHGFHCPIGSHARRANPRDSLRTDPKVSNRTISQHRILRRGRTFEDESDKGLMFLCFNTQINRQFEFIQQNWIQNNRFETLRDESDPLLGKNRQFTIAAHPIGQRETLNELVTMMGGGYFFFPGIAAANFLSSWTQA